MLRHLATGAAAAAFFVGTTALASAQCEVGGADLEQRMADNPDARAGFTQTLVRDIRQLRNAALTLSSYGKDEACLEIAAAIDDMLENPQELQRTAGEGEPVPVWSDDPQDYSYGTARSLSEAGQIRADDLLGSDVYGADDDNLGEITDVVFSSEGTPGHVVVSHGGFLGLGEEASAVPFDMLRVSEDAEVFYVALTSEQLEGAPRFERGSFDWTGDEGWRQENDAYYEGAASENQ